VTLFVTVICYQVYAAEATEKFEIYIFNALVGSDLVGISQSCLVLGKLERLGYRTLKKVR